MRYLAILRYLCTCAALEDRQSLIQLRRSSTGISSDITTPTSASSSVVETRYYPFAIQKPAGTRQVCFFWTKALMEAAPKN